MIPDGIGAARIATPAEFSALLAWAMSQTVAIIPRTAIVPSGQSAAIFVGSLEEGGGKSTAIASDPTKASPKPSVVCWRGAVHPARISPPHMVPAMIEALLPAATLPWIPPAMVAMAKNDQIGLEHDEVL
jgi:hypothetical protein